MKKLIIFTMAVLLIMSAYAIPEIELLTPLNGFYWILGGKAMGNQTFTVNATPDISGNIINITLYTNISGTWKANFSNTTVGAEGTEVNRIFTSENISTSISTNILSDGLVFIWGAYSCDNISIFTNEPVMLISGNGRLAKYPVSTIDSIMNDTGLPVGNGACNITTASGLLKCNQTKINGSWQVVELLTPLILVNYTISSTCKLSSNRTVFVEDAPIITLNKPANSAYDTDGQVTINLTVAGDDDNYNCQIYSNDTGNWSVKRTVSTLNNTYGLSLNTFNEKNGIVWNSKCFENLNSNVFGWSASNYTLTVDKTAPLIVLNHPNDEEYKTSKTLYFNATVNDSNLNTCRLYLNETNSNWNSTNYNESITSMSSGTVFNFSQKVVKSDIKWGVWCNDSAANSAWSSNYTVRFMTTLPGLLRNINYSKPSYCDRFTIEFNFSKEVNLTMEYSLTSNGRNHSSVQTDYSINQTVDLIFNDSYETTFYANLTFCDLSGNCNTTKSFSVVSPVSLCSGWSIWSVYDAAINMSDLYSASKVDDLYWWNQTGQAWTGYSTADTSFASFNLTKGNAAWYYTSSDETYFRTTSKPITIIFNETVTMNILNTSANLSFIEDLVSFDGLRDTTSVSLMGFCNVSLTTGILTCNTTGSNTLYVDYKYRTFDYYANLSIGDAIFPLYHDYTFGNLSYSVFLNRTGGNLTPNNIWTGGLLINFTDFASYNNSAQNWVGFNYKWSENNATRLGKSYKNGLDTIWTYAENEYAINFTAKGNVIGNWT